MKHSPFINKRMDRIKKSLISALMTKIQKIRRKVILISRLSKKIIAATNRPDVLDPALMRSGRLDRKIEFPLPNEDSRVQIMQIHSRKMNYDKGDVNFKELARATDGFNGAQLKAVCVEAGMWALKRDANVIGEIISP